MEEEQGGRGGFHGQSDEVKIALVFRPRNSLFCLQKKKADLKRKMEFLHVACNYSLGPPLPPPCFLSDT